MKMSTSKKNKNSHISKFLNIALFVVPTILIVILYIISRYFPNAVYKIYTTGLFKVITYLPKILTKGWRYSFAEVCLVIFILFFLIYTVSTMTKTIIALVKKGDKPFHRLIRYGSFIVKTICVILSTFILFGAFNYNSLPLSDIAGYELRKRDTQTLAELCLLLEEKASASYVEVRETDIFVYTSEANKAYEKAREQYDFFDGYTEVLTSAKPAFSSIIMCYLQISGIYPYLLPESVINAKTPTCALPHTVCHELAHQMGFAREDEANYVAFIACISSDKQEFVYSGYYEAFLYSMNALYVYDYEKWEKIHKETDPRILEDMKKSSEFWDSFSTPNDFLGNLSENVNDAYLNINNVSDGTHSYGRVVDLLLAHYF
ncbi:MAG: DUF3810 domain-containing protein [Clostridia bacterium]|nr:DUF3810 domain-containing protein [Clostridia bacterium]